MLKIFFSLLVFSVFIPFFSNAQGWQWGFRSYTMLYPTISSSHNGDLNARNSAVDSAGNLFITSHNDYAYCCILGADTVFADTVAYNTYGPQLVVSKQNSAGDIVFAIGSNQLSDAVDISIKTSTSGCLYIYGLYDKKFHLDTVTLLNSDSNTTKYFIAKVNPTGHCLWAKDVTKTLHSLSPNTYGKLGVDKADNLIITGVYGDSSQLIGTDTLFNVSANGEADIFMRSSTVPETIYGAKVMAGELPIIVWPSQSAKMTTYIYRELSIQILLYLVVIPFTAIPQIP